MGSFGDLRIGGFEIVEQKYQFTLDILSIFVESDRVKRVVAPDGENGGSEGEEEELFIGYISTAKAISDRLDLMGFTADASRVDYFNSLSNELDDLEISLSMTTDDFLGYQGRMAFLKEFTFDAWIESIRKLRSDPACPLDFDPANGYRNHSRALTPNEFHILCERNAPTLGYYCSDLRYLVRAFLLCVEDSAPVVLDCSQFVDHDDQPLVESAKSEILRSARSIEKVLVLTEGCSDTRILRESLEVLFPHLREFLSFLDHEQFSVAGGAGNLLNLLRGFAGAGVSNRVVALFDNDTAGSVQMAKAARMSLAPNFRLVQLPYLALANAYPTLGPTGLVETDINSSACSLELYLGRSVLLQSDQTLTPIQWTGYERSLRRYQGELVDKSIVADRYLGELRNGTADTSDMAAVFDCIRTAFH